MPASLTLMGKAFGQMRLSFALGLGGTLVALAITANSGRAPRWIPAAMGGIGSALAAGLIMDRSRRQD